MPRRLLVHACLPLLLLGALPPPAQPRPGDRPAFKGPLGLAVDADGRRAFVALHDAGAVAVVDLQAGRVLREVAVGRGPYDVAAVGDELFVTCERDDEMV